ncbi:hypothetical protein VT84_10970 [Gemmata sp. SH-PL17]|uniref:hypothetical protein n=1 Tax=Gemmata sp. SH-PL17 TaxID=1630693 RepID=UPI00078DB15A|nr:hypothetical protein [Gemmata sp. SH-PL17]AMV24911.1 hypothetical protein VT84_10970 [Gemmata sp. SH-PL17]
MRKLSRTARRYWQPVCCLAVVNFAVFFVVSTQIGGDAVSGRIEGGRYVLSNHGVRTEVSRTVYNYSLIHTVSVWVTHGLAVGGGLILQALGRLYESQPPSGTVGK